MTNNNLMIGNVVFYNRLPHEVVSIGETMLTIKRDGYAEEVSISEVGSKKILGYNGTDIERYGFIAEEPNMYTHPFLTKNFKFIIGGKGLRLVYVDGELISGPSTFSIGDFHELQNLFTLLTGKKLVFS